ncbi:MAG: AAA family ATPase [Aliidiomarina sp.]|uniref:AAA family ATPase n=1 Tax=Aliidiomarina sp. TaxID=1872439 RepID=UPI0025BE588F|nr:AAA family ATPase [Aliidiomarina sp.]MCH8500574.1 AAA family ATPase [Aliidiomarina sp.]
MRLKHIKLAGFKSFVDPTKVAFPEQMTCIVGPNGCGKSNVIDAVRWVLGESSAKNLRGDAMTDVIFNGSQSRKPVSQASVELVFDNSSGRIQGEFAAFNEISVKRVVTRDAQSTYLLNGAKCRRRDITDLFLGTGLGPRSYAIIEQGMISRLIESRPQELRVFIEEAAGISKYKERRKETESRMSRTRDNLDRLTDVREELGQQLAKLQRQAAAAQRYKTLKAEERELKAQLQAIRWMHYQEQCDHLEHQVNSEEAELQRWVAEQRGSERGQTELREQESDWKQKVDDIQQQFYRLNTETTRLEQQIQHGRNLNQQRQQQIEQQRRQLMQLAESLTADQHEYEQLSAEQEELGERLQLAAEQRQMAELGAEEAESELQAWQEQWQSWQQRHGDASREKALQVAEVQSARQLMQQFQQRLENIATEIAELPTVDEHAQQALLQQMAKTEDELQVKLEQLEQCQQDKSAAQEQLESCQSAYATEQDKQQKLRGKISSLQTLLSSREEPGQVYAEHLGLLRELLTVPDMYQQAAEQILAPWLSLPVFDAYVSFEGFGLQLEATSSHHSASLAQFQTEQLQHLPLLTHFAVAESLAQAQGLLASNAGLFAVLMPAGQVCGRSWYLHAEDEAGPLRWQQELIESEEQLHSLEESCQQLTLQQTSLKEQIERFESQREQLRNEYSESALLLAQLQERERAQVSQQEDLLRRRQRLEQEQNELDISLQGQEERIEQAELQLFELEQIEREREPERERLIGEGERLKQVVAANKSTLQREQNEYHQVQLQHSQVKSRAEHLQQSMLRAEAQQATLHEHIAELEAALQTDDELQFVAEELAMKLVEREEVEAELHAAREQLATVSEEIRILNQGQSAVVERIARQQERVQAGKLELAAARERGHALLDSLKEMNVALKTVLETMPEETNEKEWQQRLETTSRKIQQLGAINLAALEEVEVQAERKAYLDAQHEDLSASLTTLEDAIKKIDRETRQRFKVTFDQVNQDLQRLFPKVFGGGQAYLDLTEDDLLETGVTIMARPPGKKNSTIHLLSGGEKALTALALVFAIFRLNPAPFCLLDEVDAPLDDVNVGRFCRLVQEMSETVQFIYISHNKIAMEMALHLAGVTMQEPGVSRLVAVDVEEALALAEA